MDPQSKGQEVSEGRNSSGPLRVHAEGDRLVVTGFGLWIPVKSKEEAKLLIQELEENGFKICY